MLTADLRALREQQAPVGKEALSYALAVYASYGHATEASSVLQELRGVGGASLAEHNLALSAACDAAGTVTGDLSLFHSIYDTMRADGILPDAETYRLLVRQLRKAGKKALVGRTVDEMLRAGHPLTVHVMNEVISACPTVAEAMRAFRRFQGMGVAPNSNTFCALLTVCRVAGDLQTAEKLFAMRGSPSAAEWDALMRVHCVVSGVAGVTEVLNRMHARGIAPGMPTHAIVLAACAEAKNQVLAESYLRRMVVLGHMSSKASIGNMMAVYAATGDARQAQKLLDWSASVNIPPSETTLCLFKEAMEKGDTDPLPGASEG